MLVCFLALIGGQLVIPGIAVWDVSEKKYSDAEHSFIQSTQKPHSMLIILHFQYCKAILSTKKIMALVSFEHVLHV